MLLQCLLVPSTLSASQSAFFRPSQLGSTTVRVGLSCCIAGEASHLHLQCIAVVAGFGRFLLWYGSLAPAPFAGSSGAGVKEAV